MDDLNPVEELLAILPGSPYECDVMYYAKSINKLIKRNYIDTLKVEYNKLYENLVMR